MLKRISRMERYTTGDGQYETSEYTWEDFNQAKIPTTAGINSPEQLLRNDIISFFKENPEKLMQGGLYASYSLDEIKNILQRFTWF